MSVPNTTSAPARYIAESIAALPPLPETALKILDCFGDEFIDAEKIVTIVGSDPGISAKLLGVANSAYFGLAQPVNSIHEAITRVLGVDTVRSLVLGMTLQRSFNATHCPGFDTTRFWQQALLTAACCKKLAASDHTTNDATRDLAYSAGLCHNLGLMALAHLAPDRTTAVLQAHSELAAATSLSSLFFAEFETDHKRMTADLARAWSLPEPMIAAYDHRAFPESPCGCKTCLIVAAGAAAVGNTEADDGRQTDLQQWAKEFALSVADLQNMAVFDDEQIEKVQSLACNLTG